MSRLTLRFALAAALTLAVRAQEPPLSQIRTQYLTGNFAGASTQAKAALQPNPDQHELRVWVALGGRPGVARTELVELRNRAPESVWTTLASALIKDAEAKEPCEEALKKAPGNPDVLELATLILTRKARENRKTADLRAFLEANQAALAGNAHTLLAEAEAWKMLDVASGSAQHQAQIAARIDRALELDPANVAATIKKANLMRNKDGRAAYEYLKAAAARHPASYDVHTLYWEVIASLPGAAGGPMEKEILADAGQLLSAKKPEKSFIYLVPDKLEANLQETAEAVENLVLAKYPNSALSDAIALRHATKEPPMTDAEQSALMRIDALKEFLARDKHFDQASVVNASSHLAYLLASQEKPDLDLLYKSLTALQNDWMELAVPAAVVKLADARYRLRDLERIALAAGDGLWQTLVDQNREFLDPGWVDFMATNRTCLMQDALGWVYFQMGRTDEALDKLNASLKLLPRSVKTLIHRGRLFAAKGQFDLAEADMNKALESRYSGTGPHPALRALRDVYKMRHGSEAGIEAYMTPILTKERGQRKVNTLAARIRNPKDMPSFKLLALDGSTVSSDQFKGKTLVINFWATWCGPCRKEMPDLEKFYQKYKNDPAVALLAISTDTSDTPDATVRSLIDKGRYTFPVLRGPDYALQNKISAIPVTWFVDPQGKLAFSQLGAAAELVEEFTWRIDALKDVSAKQ